MKGNAAVMRKRLDRRKAGEPVWMSVIDAAVHFQVSKYLIYTMRNEGRFYFKKTAKGTLIDVVNPVSPEPVPAPPEPEKPKHTTYHVYTVGLKPEEAEALEVLADQQCRSPELQIKWLVRCALEESKL